MRLNQTKYNRNTLLFIASVMLVTVMLFVSVSAKKGFHEDEIFSFGASNNKYDNMFFPTADRDAANQIIGEKIITGNVFETVGNVAYYLTHSGEFWELLQEKDLQPPVWKTPGEAKEYLTASPGQWWNYISPYYHQSRDVHPPLFYFAVHFVSTFVPGVFSKYIIFSINFLAIIGVCFVFRKIFRLYHKEHLAAPAVLLYGLSMGASSTAVFLRMYAMLAFFVCLYFYLTLKFVKNGYSFDKKLKRQLMLAVILGFLTQYFMCLFILPTVILLSIKMLRDKKREAFREYMKLHIISGIISVIIFPASIYHIFFSYRGFGAGDSHPFLAQLGTLANRIFYAFSLPTLLGILLLLGFGIYVGVQIRNQKRDSLFTACLFAVPVLVYVLLAAKLTPRFSTEHMLRYIMPILPLVAVCFVFGAEKVLEKMQKETVRTGLIYLLVFASVAAGIFGSSPSFLYQEETRDMEIAKEYRSYKQVLLTDNYFTFLNALPEMTVFDKTLIVCREKETAWNALAQDEALQKGDAFVLTMENHIAFGSDREKVVEEVLEMTGYSRAEQIPGSEQSRHLFYLIQK